MSTAALRADLLLLLTAAIWGLAFVAQRLGMDHMGPFYFNALRFTLGALALAPLLATAAVRRHLDIRLLPGGLLAGGALFAGASLQQVGIVETTAGKAGFITGLYVVLVPLAGLLAGRASTRNTWTGSALALVGLYLLSFDGQTLRPAPGDGLVLLGAFFWTAITSRIHAGATIQCVHFQAGIVGKTIQLELIGHKF